jgi:hypothetical protein
LLVEVFDMSLPVYLIANRFDFGTHTEKMKAKHPEWTRRQIECCLYWQGTARKQLREIVTDFRAEHGGLEVIMCPEACGVNITATMQRVSVTLEWPPVEYAWQVALAGTPKAADFCLVGG